MPQSTSPHVSHHTIGGPVLADDFEPAAGAGGSVVFAEWWGSVASSSSWELTLHLGGPVGGPGLPLAVPPFSGGTKYFVTSAGTPTAIPGVFYFSAALPGDFVVQDNLPLGAEYWFSAANADPNWTWAFAGAGPTVGDEHWAAVASLGSTPCGDGGPHCGAWNTIGTGGIDFAFRLSTVPEPATWLLTSGALLAVGLRRQLR